MNVYHSTSTKPHWTCCMAWTENLPCMVPEQYKSTELESGCTQVVGASIACTAIKIEKGSLYTL